MEEVKVIWAVDQDPGGVVASGIGPLTFRGWHENVH